MLLTLTFKGVQWVRGCRNGRGVGLKGRRGLQLAQPLCGRVKVVLV